MNLTAIIQSYNAYQSHLYKEIGLIIKTCRHEKELSRQDVADSLDVTSNTVYNWEKGKTIPNLNQCEILEQLLK